jgi:hypothetical protein
VTSASPTNPSDTLAYWNSFSTVPGIKTVTLAPPCDDYVKREAAAEPEAAAEDADALGKRQLLLAVQALAADKISKGCQCLSLGTKTVTKTKYDITVSVSCLIG